MTMLAPTAWPALSHRPIGAAAALQWQEQLGDGAIYRTRCTGAGRAKRAAQPGSPCWRR